MAWELYNDAKHAPVNGKRLRFAGWKHATSICGVSIEATKVLYNSTTINFSDVKYIRPEFTEYYVLPPKVVVQCVPGYGDYSIPLKLLEVWIADESSDNDYTNTTTRQRCTSKTKLDPCDTIFMITRSAFRDEYKCEITSTGTLDIRELKPQIRFDDRTINVIRENHHKKMRKGCLVGQRVLNTTVLLDGCDNTQLMVPFEYLEVLFSDARATNRQPKQKAPTKQSTTTHTKESKKMNLQFNAKHMLDQNKDALLIAAKIEVGGVAVQQVTKIIKKQLPLMMRGYADLPIFEILVANLVVMAITQFCPDNEKAQIIADAMLLSAMQKQIREFNIPQMIEEFTSKIDITGITRLSQVVDNDE